MKARSKVLVTGRSIGQRIGAGHARIIRDVKEMARVRAGDVLVADMTDPDWEPVMKRAAAIVTNRGGRTCHAAIIARELGIPAVVGCGNATSAIQEDQAVTVSCAEGDTGYVYEGMLEFEQRSIELDAMPPIPVKITMNVGNPDRAFDFAGHSAPRRRARAPGIHHQPHDRRASARAARIRQAEPGAQGHHQPADRRLRGPVSFYVDKLSEGIAQIAAAFAPEPVIVRLSDFKSNEYANLIGGKNYEPHEENPMLGFRGASRYIDKVFRPCFELECRALKRVRDEMGLTNVQVMVPFVRTLAEAKAVTELLADNGLKRGDNGLKHIMMCELPTNALLADRYLEYFDGMSIGSNDMTQLALGLDRDSGVVAKFFDERDDAVKALMSMAIKACKRAGQVRRHLRPGTLRPSGTGALAGRSGHRQPVAESRHGGRDLDVPGERRAEVSAKTVRSKLRGSTAARGSSRARHPAPGGSRSCGNPGRPAAPSAAPAPSGC